jgi:hypothetical protein
LGVIDRNAEPPPEVEGQAAVRSYSSATHATATGRPNRNRNRRVAGLRCTAVASARPGPHRWTGATPAQRVRVELEASREAGVDWASAWRAALSQALAAITERSVRDDWTETLRWSQTYFRAAYERRHVGGPIRPDSPEARNGRARIIR